MNKDNYLNLHSMTNCRADFANASELWYTSSKSWTVFFTFLNRLSLIFTLTNFPPWILNSSLRPCWTEITLIFSLSILSSFLIRSIPLRIFGSRVSFSQLPVVELHSLSAWSGFSSWILKSVRRGSSLFATEISIQKIFSIKSQILLQGWKSFESLK